MPRYGAISRIALVCAASLAVAGCKGATEAAKDQGEGSWFSKPVQVFTKPEWAKPTGDSKTVDLGPKGPVAPEEFVSADGRCASPISEPATAPAPPTASVPPADRPVGSIAGDLAGAPMSAATQVAANSAEATQGAAAPGGPRVLGGIALGMTECQTVQRAGSPGNVAISAGSKGERSVTLTYLSGPWPGIYRFADGRLKEIERAPGQPEQPKKPVKKNAKKPVKKPDTAALQ